MNFKIVIIESINSQGYETGTVLNYAIENLISEINKSITLKLYRVGSKDYFFQILNDIYIDLKKDTFLILHIESHGHLINEGGIFLCSTDVIHWQEILHILRKIQNKEHSSDMLLFLGSCYGNKITNSMKSHPNNEIPFKYLISSANLVFPKIGILVRDYKEFYKLLFNNENVLESFQGVKRITETFTLDAF